MNNIDTSITFPDYIFQNSFNDYKNAYTDNYDLIPVYKVLQGYSCFKKQDDKIKLVLQNKLLETYGLLAKIIKNIPPECVDIISLDTMNSLYQDIVDLGLENSVDKLLNK